jgi:hypothetical protein
MAGLMKNWFLLLRTDKYVDAEILRGMLEENQIPVMVVNKQDSSYIFLGELEVYVPLQFRELACNIMGGTLAN